MRPRPGDRILFEGRPIESEPLSGREQQMVAIARACADGASSRGGSIRSSSLRRAYFSSGVSLPMISGASGSTPVLKL